MSAMGVKINNFEVPVCNSFQATIVNDQLCYEVDLNRFSVKNNIENELELGFNFLMDYNEDRQVTFDQNLKMKKLGLANNLVASDHNKHAFVYVDTIGIIKIICRIELKILAKIAEPVKFIGEGEYNLNSLKEIVVTGDFLGLDKGQ